MKGKGTVKGRVKGRDKGRGQGGIKGQDNNLSALCFRDKEQGIAYY